MKLRKEALSIALGGVLSLSVTQAGADSLLAPWVVSDPAQGVETLLSLKFEGGAFVDDEFSSTSDVHYYWFRQAADPDDPCEEIDTRGTVSSWDMILQTVGGLAAREFPLNDQSDPQFVPSPIAAGFMVIDDEGAFDREGNFSGFAYVIDLNRGDILDYKLLNNPFSTRSGDFAALGRHRVVDFSWMPTGLVDTQWLVLAVGPAMTNNPAGWDGSVQINQNDGFAQVPFGGFGVYDNDEKVWSGAKARNVTCQAILDRSDLMTVDQELATSDGGWTRKSIVSTNDNTTGAVVYKLETVLIAPNDTVMNHETAKFFRRIVNDLP